MLPSGLLAIIFTLLGEILVDDEVIRLYSNAERVILTLLVYWASQQVVGRDFVCLPLELASQPSQPALLPTAKAGYGKARYSWIIFRKISPYNLLRRPVGIWRTMTQKEGESDIMISELNFVSNFPFT